MNEMIPQVGDTEPRYTVREISPLGVGNPESAISYKKQIESGELTAEVAEAAAEYILSGEGMRQLTDTDDGCIDGRRARRVVFVAESGEFSERSIEDPAEHLRAKVAGGGYVTSLAMHTGLGKSADSIENDLSGIVSDLAESHVYCGAHTGEHAHEHTTDCGANDKFPLILANGLGFKDVIAANTIALVQEAGLDVDESILEDMFSNWKAAVDAQYGEASSGVSRLDVIEDGIATLQQTSELKEKPLAVLKDLEGDHKEDFIIVNYRDGETFSQAALNEFLAARHPDTQAQAFVVDASRIVTLAKALSGDNEQDFHQALYAGVAFQLATAATLTDGSLRTFIVK